MVFQYGMLLFQAWIEPFDFYPLPAEEKVYAAQPGGDFALVRRNSISRVSDSLLEAVHLRIDPSQGRIDTILVTYRLDATRRTTRITSRLSENGIKSGLEEILTYSEGMLASWTITYNQTLVERFDFFHEDGKPVRVEVRDSTGKIGAVWRYGYSGGLLSEIDYGGSPDGAVRRTIIHHSPDSVGIVWRDSTGKPTGSRLVPVFRDGYLIRQYDYSSDTLIGMTEVAYGRNVAARPTRSGSHFRRAVPPGNWNVLGRQVRAQPLQTLTMVSVSSAQRP